MSSRLMIKEDIVEWIGSAPINAKNTSIFGREMCLVSSKGHILARRFVGQNSPTEAYLFLQERQIKAWREIVNTVHTAEMSPEELNHLLLNRLLLYGVHDHTLTSMKRFHWRLMDRSTKSQSLNIYGQHVSLTYEDIYLIEGFSGESKIEWRVFYSFIPGYIRDVPIYAELWLDSNLYRRHHMIYNRWATQRDIHQFKSTPSHRIKPTSVDKALGAAEFELPGIIK